MIVFKQGEFRDQEEAEKYGEKIKTRFGEENLIVGELSYKGQTYKIFDTFKTLAEAPFVNLSVPFEEKEVAKKYGAKWNGGNKVWSWDQQNGPLPIELRKYRRGFDVKLVFDHDELVEGGALRLELPITWIN